jgi:hypothetical protein
VYIYTVRFVTELRDTCLRETFKEKCPDGEVIIMHSARFGRMRLGNCINRDFGQFGNARCSKDVLPIVDQLCSGRQECNIDVFNTFRESNPCVELESYLELNFTCLKGMPINSKGFRGSIDCLFQCLILRSPSPCATRSCRP